MTLKMVKRSTRNENEELNVLELSPTYNDTDSSISIPYDRTFGNTFKTYHRAILRMKLHDDDINSEAISYMVQIS
jgi:hypothetical protein